jgi:hypothetical protein
MPAAEVTSVKWMGPVGRVFAVGAGVGVAAVEVVVGDCMGCGFPCSAWEEEGDDFLQPEDKVKQEAVRSSATREML